MGSFYDLLLASQLSGGGGGGGGGNVNEDGLVDGSLASEYENSRVLAIRGNGFRGNNWQNSNYELSFPNVVSVGINAFTDFAKLKSISLPKCETVDQFAFSQCTNVNTETFVLPKVTKIGGQAFRYCATKIFDILGSTANSLGDACFANNMSLHTIIIRCTTGVVPLNNVNCLNISTKFASGGAGGDIYVPSALIDSYKSATNWNTINGYGTITWHSIEGSTYATQYADGTPISA